MKKVSLIIALIGMSFVLQAQDDTVNGKLTINNISNYSKSIQFGAGGPTHWFMGIGNNAGDFFHLGDNDNKRLVIRKSSGNVGIGTTTPIKKLDVRSIGIGANWISGVFGSTTASDRVVIGNHEGTASIGAHNNGLSAWADLSINFGGGNVGIGTKNPVGDGLTVVGGDTGQDFLTLDRPNIGKFRFNAGAYNTRMTIGSGVADRFSIGYDNTKGGLALTSDIEFSSHNHSLFIKNDGSIGIGTTDTKGFKLGVQGKIAAEEVKVALHANWADFVFKNNYNLPTLKEVEEHIKEKGHLKDIPSAEEVKKDGFFLGEMDSKLLQKIEELTLYTIEQEKMIKNLQKETKELKDINSKLLELQKRLEKLEPEKQKSL